MKRKIILHLGRLAISSMGLTLMAWIVPSNGFAQEINIEQAKRNATEFIKRHAASIPVKDRRGIASIHPQANDLKLVYTETDQGATPALYVFGLQKKGGFIITSADERLAPVVGYSEEGVFDEHNMSCCMKDILQNIGKQVTFARRNNLPKYSQRLANDSRREIAPLLQSRWAQRSPFNDNCPIDPKTGSRCVTGCVATAMAQVMYYHKWPETGTGSKSYLWNGQILSADFNRAYHLDKMKDSYDMGDKDENLSTFLYHCGVSVKMLYSSEGSSAPYGDELVQHFRYSSALEKIVPTSDQESEVNTILYNELSHGRPILVSGDNKGVADSGHAFVCDGYRPDDFFHFNLGWGSSSDLYFKYNAIGYGYNDNQTFVIHIMPKKDPVTINGIDYELTTDEAFLVGGTFKGDVVIPDAVAYENKEYRLLMSELKEGVFSNNNNITSVKLPNSLTTIGEKAFQNCERLTYAEMGDNVTVIKNGVFMGCERLNSVRLSSNLTRLGSGAFKLCDNLTAIEIPNKVTHIEFDCFSYCSSLNTVTLPASLTSIESWAFNGCTSLRSIYANMSEPISIYANVFDYVNKSACTLYVPKGCVGKYKAAEVWKEFGRIVEMEDDATKIDGMGEKDEKFILNYYTIDGKPVDTPANGVNIIKMNDGTAKKIVIKN